jgi:MFS family permease
MGIIFCAAGWSEIFGGLISYGIARGTSLYPAAIAPWKIVFLVTGLIKICVGIIFLLVIPDNQLNAWWLSKDDRRLAVERVRINQQGIGNKHFKMYQLKEALTDPLTWAFVLYECMMCSGCAFESRRLWESRGGHWENMKIPTLAAFRGRGTVSEEAAAFCRF